MLGVPCGACGLGGSFGVSPFTSSTLTDNFWEGYLGASFLWAISLGA